VRLQSIIRAVTPPVLFQVGQRIWRRIHGLGSYDFEGPYPTLTDVPLPAARYSDAELAAQAVERGVARFMCPQPPVDDHAGRTFLPLVVSLIRPATVIDFGGDVCVGLSRIKAHCPPGVVSGLSYVLIETPAMCEALRGRIAGVTVTDDIPTPDQVTHPLVVNASSSLQYVNDWRGTLKRLAALKPQAFIISLTSFTDEPTYALRQTNSPHRRLASWVFNRAELIAAMAQSGYRQVFTVEHDLPVTYKGVIGPRVFRSIVFQS
jgi:putative methyltransferase (TIGR04325 family)